jgi:hypothetical protein
MNICSLISVILLIILYVCLALSNRILLLTKWWLSLILWFSHASSTSRNLFYSWLLVLLFLFLSTPCSTHLLQSLLHIQRTHSRGWSLLYIRSSLNIFHFYLRKLSSRLIICGLSFSSIWRQIWCFTKLTWLVMTWSTEMNILLELSTTTPVNITITRNCKRIACWVISCTSEKVVSLWICIRIILWNGISMQVINTSVSDISSSMKLGWCIHIILENNSIGAILNLFSLSFWHQWFFLFFHVLLISLITTLLTYNYYHVL